MLSFIEDYFLWGRISMLHAREHRKNSVVTARFAEVVPNWKPYQPLVVSVAMGT